jgi:hypothetical protein
MLWRSKILAIPSAGPYLNGSPFARNWPVT